MVHHQEDEDEVGERNQHGGGVSAQITGSQKRVEGRLGTLDEEEKETQGDKEDAQAPLSNGVAVVNPAKEAVSKRANDFND